MQALIFQSGINLTAIGYNAFNGCSILATPLNIPPCATSTTIGYGAFHGCSALPSLFIPQSVSEIGYQAFKGCNSLHIVKIDNKSVALQLTGSYGEHFDCSIDTLYLGRNLNQTNGSGTFAGNLGLKFVSS